MAKKQAKAKTTKKKGAAKAKATPKAKAAKSTKPKPAKAKPTKAKAAKAKAAKAAKPKPAPQSSGSTSADAIAQAIGNAAWDSGAHIAAPTGGPSMIDGDAATAYSLQFHVHGDISNNAIELYRGTTQLPANLELDFATEDSPDGTIVDGDLEVAGTIVNRSSDRGPFLLVTGNVRAKNLISGGSEIVVLGDLIIDGVIFGFYNHGSITVHGTTRAKAIITEYHSFDLRGPVEAITISGRGDITKSDMFDSYAPALVPEVLAPGRPEGGYPDWDRTTQAILEGRPVLRDDVPAPRLHQ